MEFLLGCLPFLIIIAIAIIAVVVAMYYEKKRREAIQKVAGDLGLEFFPQGIPWLLEALRGFKLVSAGDGHQITNTIRGITDEVELTIFDLTYGTGSGKHRSTHRQTVIYFKSPQLRLPDFAVCPEGFFHKIAKLFGTKDINFPEDQPFSASFLLQGASEAHVRQLFTPTLRNWYAERPGVTAEGRGDQLLFFRAEQRVSPEKIPGLLEEGFGLYKLLASEAASTTAAPL